MFTKTLASHVGSLMGHTKLLALAGTAAGALALAPQTASAHDRFSFGITIAAPAPVYATPVYTVPAPVYTAPVYSAPVYSAPVYSAPVYTAPAYTAPAYTPPAPVYTAPAPTYAAPAQEAAPEPCTTPVYTPTPVYVPAPVVVQAPVCPPTIVVTRPYYVAPRPIYFGGWHHDRFEDRGHWDRR